MIAFTRSILFFLFSCFTVIHLVCTEEEYDVKCEDGKPVCTCPKEADVCNFVLTIRELQTFTRYLLGDVRTDQGKVWYIDEETGEFKAIPSMKDSVYRCLQDDDTCTEAITVDGNTFRTVITVNDQFPGPTLIVHHKQIVSVSVTNRLTSEEVTIHWHGMHQVSTPWMDGVHHVSQCGIAPSSTFRYIFRADPAGTHWYHSHTGAQRTDGLFGAFIVLEDPTVLDSVMKKVGTFKDMPELYTLSFLDWQRTYSIELFTQIHAGVRYFTSVEPPNDKTPITSRTYSTDGSEVGPVSFWSGLINGKGKHSEVPYKKTQLNVFNVEYSSTYRFRVIGVQSLFAFRVSIDGHKMKIIATDGHFVNPIIVDFLIVHSGERYDFLLDTKPTSTVIKKFIIRGETLEENKDHVAEAILRYGSSTDKIQSTEYEQIIQNSPRKRDECSTNNRCTALNCPFLLYPPNYYTDCMSVDTLTLLNPLVMDDASLPNYETDAKLFLNFGFEGASQTSAINSRNFKTPSAPLSLLNPDQNEYMDLYDNEVCEGIDKVDVCSSASKSISPDCVCVHIRDIPPDQSVQLVFSAVTADLDPMNNARFFAHPIHLHGHSFHIVKIGFGEYDDNGMLTGPSTDIDCLDKDTCTVPQWRNNPLKDKVGKIPNNVPLKDTVLVPAGGYVVVYIQSNNPGYWFLHCHIEVHQLEGMAVVINEGFDQHNTPPESMRQCGDFSWTVDDFNCKETGMCGSALNLHNSFILISAMLLILFFQ